MITDCLFFLAHAAAARPLSAFESVKEAFEEFKPQPQFERFKAYEQVIPDNW